MTEPIDVIEALETLKAKRPTYQRYAKYYSGVHDLNFASEAWRDTFGKLLKRMNYNRCPSVVDAISDRLQIEGWQTEGGGSESSPHDAAQEEWEQCRGDYLQGLVHVESLRSGDGYLIVWPKGEDPNKPVWRMHRGDVCMVLTNDESAEPEIAVKLWRVESGVRKGHWRLTIYTAELITRWMSLKPGNDQPTKADQWVPYEDDEQPWATNPYGVIPVIHFPNNPQYQGESGISELSDVIPLQDGLNYSVWQVMVAGEFVSWPMRWATGVEPTLDPLSGEPVETIKSGIDRWIEIGSELAKVGQLPGADMEPFLAVQESWDTKISRVSRVPVHWLGLVGQLPSGESLKTAESPFVGKLRDRQLAFGASWEAAMDVSLRIKGARGEGSVASPIWKSPEPRSDTEIWMLAQQKQAVGIPQKQIWREAGYSEEQIIEFEALNRQKMEEDAERFATTMARGGNDPFAPKPSTDASDL